MILKIKLIVLSRTKKVIDIKFMDSIRLLEGNLEGTESALIMYEEN